MRILTTSCRTLAAAAASACATHDSTTGPTARTFSCDLRVALTSVAGRLEVTSSGGSSIPLAYPVQVFPFTADTSTAVMDPGTMSYFRLDAPAGAPTVSIQFAGPGGAALPAGIRPQLAIFRLPPGQ